jgi:hypothetical protein
MCNLILPNGTTVYFDVYRKEDVKIKNYKQKQRRLLELLGPQK